jgi:DNA-binding transcriptional regulator LsrR (DeoR family)
MGWRLAQDSDSQKMDIAARAAWLYFIGGNTQEEIAQKLRISRPTAQRLVTAALSNHLVTFRFEHGIARCMELSEVLRDRFNLAYCDVVPTDVENPDSIAGMASSAASFLEKTLSASTPTVVAIGTGRTLRAAVEALHPMEGQHHTLVALTGNVGKDGSSTQFDVIVRLANLTKARHFPIPLPVFSETAAQRDLLTSLKFVQNTHNIARNADVTLCGVGQMTLEAPQYIDGFLTRDELDQQMALGSVGEIAGWSYDRNGVVLGTGVNSRLTAVPIGPANGRLVVGVAGGERKVQAIYAALVGGLLTGLITDEATAERLQALTG